MTTKARILVVALLLVPLAGCVENMGDLKDRLQSESTNQTGTTNTTDPVVDDFPMDLDKDQPVARITLYEKGGALVHRSDFMALDGMVASPLTAATELSFIASDSEALDKTASLESYTWEFGDGTTATGSTATHAYADAGGVFTVSLTVKDSQNRTDVQNLTVGIQPAPLTVTQDEGGTITAGVAGNGAQAGVDRETFAFSILAEGDGGLQYRHVSTTLTLAPASDTAADMDLAVANATQTIARGSAPGPNEVVTIEGVDAGEYTATVILNIGAQADFTLVIETVYQPLHPDVEALFGGGHGGHQH